MQENYDGAWDLIKWSKATFRSTNSNIRSLKIDYGLAILVSPDYEVAANKKMVDQVLQRLRFRIRTSESSALMYDQMKLASVVFLPDHLCLTCR